MDLLFQQYETTGMRFHVLGVPHTVTHHDARTRKMDWYNTVIPNYFDERDFTFTAQGGTTFWPWGVYV